MFVKEQLPGVWKHSHRALISYGNEFAPLEKFIPFNSRPLLKAAKSSIKENSKSRKLFSYVRLAKNMDPSLTVN